MSDSWRWKVLQGNCIEVLKSKPENSIDAIVTDPPYGLSFMGAAWDHGVPGIPFWTEIMRVLKPGGHLLAFGGTRTEHRMTCAIEDAGFEIRDKIMYLYGTGFPKSLDVSKALDKIAGKEREVIGLGAHNDRRGAGRPAALDQSRGVAYRYQAGVVETAPATDISRQWDGWGTALKPAYEPVVVARKPLIGTVAANVTAFGTGALNIDGCRIEGIKDTPASPRRAPQNQSYGDLSKDPGTGGGWDPNVGRWPSNVILDEEAGALLDASVPQTTSRKGKPRGSQEPGDGWGMTKTGAEYDDAGGPSRFFLTVRPDCWLCGGDRCEGPVGTVESSLKQIAQGRDSVLEAAQDNGQHNNGVSNHNKSSSAPNVDGPSSNGQATVESIAPASVQKILVEQLARHARSAENLCDSCAIGIAQSLVRGKPSLDGPSHLGPVSMPRHNEQILMQSLALYAESLGSIDTTPTTASLNLLCGFVRDAMRRSTPTNETEIGSVPNRLFYSPKASRKERDAGCYDLPLVQGGFVSNTSGQHLTRRDGGAPGPVRNNHPTVKPVSLMRYLVRLVTPPDGLVLDPFMGSGSTGLACLLEGFRFVGIDMSEEYVNIAEARLRHVETFGERFLEERAA